MQNPQQPQGRSARCGGYRMKLPALQFYPGDWRKDPGVQSLNYFDRGVWFEILCLMHESSDRGKLLLNGQPMPDDALATILGLDKQILTTTLNTLLTYGVAGRDDETGALINRRMVKDELLRQIRTEAGKRGGNPVLLKQKSTNRSTQAQPKPNQPPKQNPTPSSSSSVSTSSSEEKKEKRTAKPPDPRAHHPAIEAVWKTRGRYPARDLWDMVIETVGEEPDVGRMKACWVRWRGKGFSSENYGWLTDWYVNGEEINSNGTSTQDNGFRRTTAAERNNEQLKRNLAVVEKLRRESGGDPGEVEGRNLPTVTRR